MKRGPRFSLGKEFANMEEDQEYAAAFKWTRTVVYLIAGACITAQLLLAECSREYSDARRDMQHSPALRTTQNNEEVV